MKLKSFNFLFLLLPLLLTACESPFLSSSASLPLSSTIHSTSMVGSEPTSISASSLTMSLPVSSSLTSSENPSTYQYTDYYQSLQGLTDAQLMGTLRPLLRQALGSDGLFPVGRTYQAAIATLQAADQDPNDSSKVVIWYRMTSVNKTWDSGSTWNREHVWPQSLLNVDTSSSSRHKGADVHNLKPANPSDNASRGNKYFSETATSQSYNPPATIRGDIARMMFYMVTMYPDLSLVDVTSGSPATFQMGQFSLLVKWHLEDPVDAFESRRNTIIHQHQGNRNPFIDHQELVCRMFKDQTPQAQQYCLA